MSSICRYGFKVQRARTRGSTCPPLPLTCTYGRSSATADSSPSGERGVSLQTTVRRGWSG